MRRGACSALAAALAAAAPCQAGDAAAGKAVFARECHTCHAALPYVGRLGAANLPAFLANPRRYNPNTAMTFPGLRSKKDVEDVIAYITAQH